MLVPRAVTLGARAGERYQVLAGLTEGERIVASANFLVDAESRLASGGAMAGMAGVAAGGGEKAMIARIIEWSLRNRFLVLLGTAATIGAGVWAVGTTPVDALPDLSDVQVVIQTEFSEQAPQIVEDQVTYPIASEMLKVSGAPVLRGFSFFGLSLVYVLFE